MVPRPAAFETAGTERAAGLGPGLVDRADETAGRVAKQLRAVAVCHPEIAPSVDFGQSFGRNGPMCILGKDRDITIMRAETAGAAGRAVNV